MTDDTLPEVDPVPPDPQSQPHRDSISKRRMQSILLVPSMANFCVRSTGILLELKSLIAFIDEHIAEYDRCLVEMSETVFSANNLQNRLIATEFSIELLRIYEQLDVHNRGEFDAKLMEISQGDDRIALEMANLNAAFERWDNFLLKIDAGIEKTLGPYNKHSGRHDRKGSKPDPVDDECAWLLTYLTESAFDYSLVSIVSNFNSNQCAEYVLSLYEKIARFQDSGCDVILLKRGPGTKGGGYLKLVGVPFRVLLDEQESQARLRCARQSALALAGRNAIHQLVEISYTGEPTAETEENLTEETKIGEVILLQHGNTQALFKRLIMQEDDWPNVDELLAQADTLAKTNDSALSTKRQSVFRKTSANESRSERKRCCCTIS